MIAAGSLGQKQLGAERRLVGLKFGTVEHRVWG